MFIHEMLLIETRTDETDAEMRTTVDSMLTNCLDAPDWWHPYTLGRTFNFADRPHREFVCIAGSVSLHLLRFARRMNAPRAIICIGKNSDGRLTAVHTAESNETTIDPADVILV